MDSTDPLFYCNGKADGQIMTSNGTFFNVLEPAKAGLSIKVIAQSLASANRANGHYNSRFSLASHSILVSSLAYLEAVRSKYDEKHCLFIALAGLIHDGSEAYLVDVPRPIKYLDCMKPYRDIEERLQSVIYNKYLGDWEYPSSWDDIVKHADNLAVKYEFRHFMEGRDLMPWCKDIPEDAVADQIFNSVKVAAFYGDQDRAMAMFLQEYEGIREKLALRGMNVPED